MLKKIVGMLNQIPLSTLWIMSFIFIICTEWVSFYDSWIYSRDGHILISPSAKFWIASARWAADFLHEKMGTFWLRLWLYPLSRYLGSFEPWVHVFVDFGRSITFIYIWPAFMGNATSSSISFSLAVKSSFSTWTTCSLRSICIDFETESEQNNLTIFLHHISIKIIIMIKIMSLFSLYHIYCSPLSTTSTKFTSFWTPSSDAKLFFLFCLLFVDYFPPFPTFNSTTFALIFFYFTSSAYCCLLLSCADGELSIFSFASIIFCLLI